MTGPSSASSPIPAPFTEDTQVLGRILVTVGVAFAFASAATLYFVAGLKEAELFWTNEGSHPVWLRNAVRYGFYPAFIGQSALSLGLAFFSHTWRALLPLYPAFLIAQFATWALIISTLLRVVAN